MTKKTLDKILNSVLKLNNFSSTKKPAGKQAYKREYIIVSVFLESARGLFLFL